LLQFVLARFVHWPTTALQPGDACHVRLCADTLQDDSKSEELKSAASVALGGLTTGAMGAYLPTLLSAAASQVTSMWSVTMAQRSDQLEDVSQCRCAEVAQYLTG
jgi:hypothetical protein